MLLYIDPGTGSMLFSIVISIVAMAYFVWKAFLLKIKMVFTGGKIVAQKVSYPYVIYCESKRYWSVFKPIVEAFESRHIKLTYLTSVVDDPIFDLKYNHISSEFIGHGNKAFARLNILEADVVLMTTPGLDVYQLKRSKHVRHYSHILHAVSDATSYRLFGLDYFDSVLLTGEYQKVDIRALEELRSLPKKELIVVGCTYLDVMQQQINTNKQESSRKWSILVAPSWGRSGILSKYGEKLLTPLSETGYQVIVRPHPQSVESEWDVIETLQAVYNNCPNVTWDFSPENLLALSESDVLISDFSGVVFDYSFLFDRPFLYVNADFDDRPYDFGCLQDKPWKLKILPEIGVELKEDDFPNIGPILQKIQNDPVMQQNRKIAKETAWQFIGQSGERCADYLIGVHEGR